MNKEIVHQTKWLQLSKIGTWEFVERRKGNTAVCIVAVTPNAELLLVEQFRAPLGKKTIELPAGLVGDDHADEAVLIAAKREMIEETGYDPGKLLVVNFSGTSSGLTSETVTMVLGLELVKVSDGGGVEGEGITVHHIQWAKVHDWLLKRAAAGFIIDNKIYAGLYWIEAELRGNSVS